MENEKSMIEKSREIFLLMS